MQLLILWYEYKWDSRKMAESMTGKSGARPTFASTITTFAKALLDKATADKKIKKCKRIFSSMGSSQALSFLL